MWWKGLAEKLEKRRWKDRPVVLLPGNHDPLTEGSVYHPSHDFRQALPDWVHVVDRDDFELALGDEAILVARPCRSQSGQEDNALALPERASGDERIRIGMVHGSTFDMRGYQTNFPIAKDAAALRGLDYLAIGDTHAWRVYPPDSSPTVYPSAPEQTTFGETDTGNVALAFFPRHGRSVRIRRERVAHWTWRADTILSIEELRALRKDPELRRTVMRLNLKMLATAAEYEEAERILDELKGAQSQTEYVGRSSPLRRVTVTRRHHPAEGKTFEVVTGGRNQIVIRLDDESTMRIPRSWTDADGTREGMDAPEHIFTADALRTLGALVASLARRSSPEGEEASSGVDRVTAPTSGGDT